MKLKMNWKISNLKMNWQHVYPVKDLKRHKTALKPTKSTIKFAGYTKDKQPIYVSSICPCKPCVDKESKLIVHNAFDCREAVEEAERILRTCT